MVHVLLVDDEPDFVELLRVHFEGVGFSVHTAASGMEALHRARRILPDVIVLDLLLPDLDGLSVCELLRKHPSTASIPVLMLTAVGGQLCRLAGLEAGADDYVVKTVRPRDLLPRVTALLLRNTQSSRNPADAKPRFRSKPQSSRENNERTARVSDCGDAVCAAIDAQLSMPGTKKQQKTTTFRDLPFSQLIKRDRRLAELRREHVHRTAEERREAADWAYHAFTANHLLNQALALAGQESPFRERWPDGIAALAIDPT